MRCVRRVDQTDDGMVNIHGKFQGMYNLRRRCTHIGDFRYRDTGTVALAKPYPDNTLSFAHAKTGDRYLRQIDRIVGHLGRNGRAASVTVERPAVITTFDLIFPDPPGGQRHAAMRTVVAQSEYLSGRRPAKDDRLPADFPVHKPASGNIARGDAEIPDIGKNQRRRWHGGWG